MKRPAALVLVLLVAAAAGAWWFLRTPADERSARQDAQAVAAAVAGYVSEHGELPRVTVSIETTSAGEAVWGADFIVESRRVPRADAERARLFYLVGDAGRWCVEMLYSPAATFADASPSRWVAVRGEHGEAGRIGDGGCGEDYLLILSPAAVADTPPGSVIDAAHAPAGVCVAGLPGDGLNTGEVTVVDCAAGHFGEIYHSGEIESEGYGRYQDGAGPACAAAFPAFVGIPTNLSALAAEPFTVDEASWQRGDRTFSCVLFLSTDRYRMAGSARDSWR